MVDRRREAFEAGLRNPLMGDVGPLQRLYGTLSAIGSELGGADMGTPFGQRFAESQKGTKAEIKRLKALREKHPEEFGRGMMFAQEQMDPYMLGLGTGAVGGMRPLSTTRFEPAGGGMPVRALEGPGEMRALPAPVRALPMQEAAPVAPYYRNVPPEMGTSTRPLTPFQQNQVGLSTGRYGARGYAPEMAVTDFESYGPMGARPAPGAYAPSGFDQNMLAAYRQGRYNRMAGGRPAPMGGDFTLEELGSAPVPYRQGGLVYEPVGQQGAAPRQIGGPQGAPRLGYERGPIEGEWSEVGHIPYGGGYRPNFTMEGAPYTPSAATGPSMGSRMAAGSYQYTPEMAVSPTGMRFDPRLAAAVIGGGAGYMAGSQSRGQMELPPMDVYAHRGPHEYGPRMPARGNALLPDINIQSPAGATALSGQAPGPGTAFEAPSAPAPQMAAPRGGKKAAGSKKDGKKGAEQGPPTQAAFEPNLNYYVTQALDRLLGQGEAERGRQYQQYYATHPWPY